MVAVRSSSFISETGREHHYQSYLCDSLSHKKRDQQFSHFIEVNGDKRPIKEGDIGVDELKHEIFKHGAAFSLVFVSNNFLFQ